MIATMLKHIHAWLWRAIAHISAPEIITITIDLAILIFCGFIPGYIYLWIVVVINDFMMLCAHGAYLQARPNTEKGPWYTPAPLLLRITVAGIIAILVSNNNYDSMILAYAWYLLTMTAICHAFFCILLAMHATNDSWLANTEGRVGTPNWISIGRMALAMLVPHLLTVQPFGTSSNLIATFILIIAIFTDAVDGYLARKLNQTTKAGKALDPLGDKVIFYPIAVSFVIASSATALLPNQTLRILFFIFLIITFLRDILVVIWFFIYYARIPKGIGASLIDKIRMATMCIWLGISVLALTIPQISTRLALIGLVFIGIIACFSVISIAVDYCRMRKLLPPKTLD